MTNNERLKKEVQNRLIDMMYSVLDRQECGHIRFEIKDILSEALDKVDEITSSPPNDKSADYHREQMK